MILNGNSRQGRGLADHMLNGEDNDHVEVFEVRGHASEDAREAMEETDTVAKCTNCKKPHFSLSLNPPSDAELTEDEWLAAIDQAEEALGLSGQPRIIIFHEKEGRRHCHVIWSRIDAENMKAIPDSYSKNKLMEVSRDLYREHGWDMPDGMEDKKKAKPKPSRAEQEIEKRSGMSIEDHKDLVKQAWDKSDNRASFANALEEAGYILAEGKRGYVAIDIYTDDAHSVYRRLDMKKKEVEAEIGKPTALPSVDKARAIAAQRRQAISELKREKPQISDEYRQKVLLLRQQQRDERKALKTAQEAHREAEQKNLYAQAEKLIRLSQAHFERLRDKFMGLDNQAQHWAKINDILKTQEQRFAEQREILRAEQMQHRRDLQRELEAERYHNRQERIRRRSTAAQQALIEQKKAELAAKFAEDRRIARDLDR